MSGISLPQLSRLAEIKRAIDRSIEITPVEAQAAIGRITKVMEDDDSWLAHNIISWWYDGKQDAKNVVKSVNSKLPNPQLV